MMGRGRGQTRRRRGGGRFQAFTSPRYSQSNTFVESEETPFDVARFLFNNGKRDSTRLQVGSVVFRAATAVGKVVKLVGKAKSSPLGRSYETRRCLREECFEIRERLGFEELVKFCKMKLTCWRRV